ncbi:MAG: hypothetical protein ACPGNT_11655 [Rhodospirillales bacterium]
MSSNKLANKLQSQKTIEIDYQKIAGCDHFFNDHLDPLNEVVEKYLNRVLPGEAAA